MRRTISYINFIKKVIEIEKRSVILQLTVRKLSKDNAQRSKALQVASCTPIKHESAVGFFRLWHGTRGYGRSNWLV